MAGTGAEGLARVSLGNPPVFARAGTYIMHEVNSWIGLCSPSRSASRIDQVEPFRRTNQLRVDDSNGEMRVTNTSSLGRKKRKNREPVWSNSSMKFYRSLDEIIYSFHRKDN